MTHIITSLCLRDSGCVDVCPVECIVPGKPIQEWPWYYIDPDTCIDCGACIPECPFEAIFPEDEVPSDYKAKGGEYISRIGLTAHYEGTNHHGEPVVLDCVKQLAAGEVVDLTEDTQPNYDFFKSGPGYSAQG
jgi:ferredoxin